MSGNVAFEKPVTDIEVELPGTPLGWRVLVRPYEPPESVNEILLAQETKDNEAILTYVGQIVAMGSECYKAVTRSGIDLSKVDPKPKVGDWVVYANMGKRIVMKTGAEYLVMNDDVIMMIVPDPALFRAYI